MTTATGRAGRDGGRSGVAWLAAAILLLSACARQHGDPEAGVVATSPGTVLEAVQTTRGGADRLDDDRLGAFVGGYAGALIGAALGQGAGEAAGAGLGLLVGLFAGAALENEIDRREVTEYRVRLDNGETITLLVDGEARARPGERARVVFYADGDAALRPLG